jgi:monoamine oxidase
MRTVKVAIVGGGLSGLYAAALLAQHGMTDYVVIDARDVVGGRIVSAPGAAGPADRFDLGPAWFWPGCQSRLDRLVRDLGLVRFRQHEAGDMLVERTHNEAPLRTRGHASSPASMRLAGGMGALVDALRRRVDDTRIVTGQAVRRMRRAGPGVEIDSEDATGHATTWRAGHVLLAVPPRLAESGIDFAPALPSSLARQWRATDTWMAPHAKYVAVYAAPFWRDQGLSGAARSMAGPLGDIHDASMPGGSAALFGFFSVPAAVRKRVPDDVLRAHCRAQLGRLFGPQAAAPTAEFLKDWASDPYTATAMDAHATGGHAGAPDATAPAGPWEGRLTGIASEWSSRFPGYLAGAVDAASVGVRALLDPLTNDTLHYLE